MCLSKCVNRDISPKCDKVRKSQHFTKNNKKGLIFDKIMLIGSFRCNLTRLYKKTRGCLWQRLFASSDNIVLVSCHWQKSVFFFCTFPGTFHLFIKIPGKKVSFTSTPFQALCIFSQKVPGKKKGLGTCTFCTPAWSVNIA